jgi:periplasmic protein CpxP/Spy
MMLHFTRARGAIAPSALGIAGAALLVASSMAPLTYAQTTSQPKPAAVKAATSMQPGSVDERIAQLRRELKITPAQEQDWQAVAQAMKSNAEDMQNLIEQTRSQTPRERRTALEDLQVYQKFAQAHVDGLEKLTTAFAALYNGMTPEQKTNADKVFRSFEHRRPNERG